MVRYVPQILSLKIEPYMDDFLVAFGDQERLKKVRRTIDRLVTAMGLTRKMQKGFWEPTTRIEHLGHLIDTARMTFGITSTRLEKIKGIAKSLLCQARRNRCMLNQSLLRHF